MNTLKKRDCFAAGLAIFAMFFGAGNIIFPLALGRIALDKTPWGLAGLLLTAIAIPFIGLLTMIRYNGKIDQFFNTLGKVPGLIVATFIIALLGPFGAAPRCLALAYSTLSLSFPSIPLILFGATASIVIFFFSYKQNRLLKLLGYFLSPLKIGLLLFIIFKGFLLATTPKMSSTDSSIISHFTSGLFEGYKTMDLLAAFFFAPIVIASIQKNRNEPSSRKFLYKATLIGALLLALVYSGFCYLAYFYSHQLAGIPNEQLLGAIAIHILGPYAGIIVTITVTFACLTTAIALISAFSTFVEKEIVKERVGYLPILLISLLVTFIMTTLEFQGIAQFLNPFLEILYPILIVLTFYNLIKSLSSKVVYR